MDEFDIIATKTISLCAAHLSQAIDCLLRARKMDVYRFVESRLSISSIVHAFLGLESMINLIGDKLLFDHNSKIYIPDSERDYALKKLISSWAKTSCIEKLIFLLSITKKRPIPEKLLAQLRELNTLRNWIVHGFPYKETTLRERRKHHRTRRPIGWNIIDREHDIDWKKKFPNTKFGPLHELEPKDAKLGLKIILEVIKHLVIEFDQPITLNMSFGFELGYDLELIDKDLDIEKMLNEDAKWIRARYEDEKKLT